MFTLNLMATFLVSLYARNEQVVPHLESNSNEFEGKEVLVNRLNQAAWSVNRLNFPMSSAWHSKSNAFSLIVALDQLKIDEGKKIKVKDVRDSLTKFIEEMPEDYALAAREAVNNKRQRSLRDTYIMDVLKRLFRRRRKKT